MNKKELTALVQKAIKGSAEAFAQLYSYYAQNIYYLALRITKNEHDANDIVQDTLFALYKNLSKLRNPKAINGFVNTTARNFCLMTLRRRKDYLVDDEQFFEEDTLEEEFIPESYTEDKELRQKIVGIIDELPDAQRSTIMLFYFEGLSTKEIADTGNVSEEAVRGRLFRGRKGIKDAIQSGNMKGAVLAIMSISALSKILVLEAKASFSAADHAGNWAALAERIGIPSQQVLSTIQLATVASTLEPGIILAETVTKAGLAATTGAISGAGAKGIIATVLAVGVVTGGTAMVYHADKDRIPEEVPAIQVFSLDEEEVEVPTYPREETRVPSSSTIIDRGEEAIAIGEGSEFNTGKVLMASHIPVTIKRNNNLPLSYPVGSTISLQKIIDDAEISVLEGSNIVSRYYASLDTRKAGEYIVYLQATDDDNSLSNSIVVIISIEE